MGNKNLPEFSEDMRKGASYVVFFIAFFSVYWFMQDILYACMGCVFTGMSLKDYLASPDRVRVTTWEGSLFGGAVFLVLSLIGGLIWLFYYKEKKKAFVGIVFLIAFTLSCYLLPKADGRTATVLIGLLGFISCLYCLILASGIGWLVRDLVYPEGKARREKEEKEFEEERERKKREKKKGR